MTSRCQGLFPPHPFFKGKALGTRLVNPKLLNLDQFGITKDDKEERTRNYVSSLTTLFSTGSQDPLPFLFEPLAQDLHPSVSPEMALGTHLNIVQGTSSEQKETQDSVQDLPGKIPPRSVSSVAFTQPFSEPASTENQHRAEAIAEGMETARLPTPHLTVFSGDPLVVQHGRLPSKL